VLQNGLKICVLTSSFPSNPEDQIAAPFLPPFIAALQNHGAQAIVYTQDRLGDKKPVVDAPVYWFPWQRADTALVQLKPYVPTHLWGAAKLAWYGSRHLIPLLQRHQVDLCLAAWTIPSGYFAYHAKKTLGIPYCVWALGSDIYGWARYPVLRRCIRRILRQANGLFADGIDLASRVQQLAGQPCAFLPSVRPLPQDRPAAKVEVDATKTNFLFVGRWEKVKGVDVLVEAMKLLIDAGVSAYLYIVGKGSLKGLLERKIRAHALTRTIFLREDIPTATLRGYLQQCDCLVIPSRSESIPLVFSEGLQSGIPMIVSATGDLASLVHRFRLGYVVPPGEPAPLQQALATFVRNGHRREQYLCHVEAAKALFNPAQATADFLQRARGIVCKPSPLCVTSKECIL
jgi:glycosyltransferase involved in cell wall biosynthesis